MSNSPHGLSDHQNDEISGQHPVRNIPGPAGVYQRAKLRKIEEAREGEEVPIISTQDEDFARGPWLSAVDYVNANGGL